MSKSKFRVATLIGGKNTDNHRSCRAALDVLPEIIKSPDFRTTAFGITFEGNWVAFKNVDTLVLALATQPFELTDAKAAEIDGAEITKTPPQSAFEADILFPIMSGAPGVDGNLQGLFSSLGVHVVGSDALGSAICHDKSTLKLLLRAVDIPTPYHVVIPNKSFLRDPMSQAMRAATIKFPLIIKPARSTNGLGVSLARTPAELKESFNIARRFDTRILAEKFYEEVRFFECSILEDSERQNYASRILETKLADGQKLLNFKARSEAGSFTQDFPKDLSEDLVKRIQETAEQVFEAAKASGFLQVEMALTEEDELLVIEANAHPYLGKDGSFAKVWIETGLLYEDFIFSAIFEGLSRPIGLE